MNQTLSNTRIVMNINFFIFKILVGNNILSILTQNNHVRYRFVLRDIFF